MWLRGRISGERLGPQTFRIKKRKGNLHYYQWLITSSSSSSSSFSSAIIRRPGKKNTSRRQGIPLFPTPRCQQQHIRRGRERMVKGRRDEGMKEREKEVKPTTMAPVTRYEAAGMKRPARCHRAATLGSGAAIWKIRKWRLRVKESSAGSARRGPSSTGEGRPQSSGPVHQACDGGCLHSLQLSVVIFFE